MIYDTIAHADQYRGIHPGIDKVLDAIKEVTPENFTCKDVELDGQAARMSLCTYDTHDPATAVLEAHRKHIDVMYMVEGAETIYVKCTDRIQNITKEYSDEIDALIGDMDSDVVPVLLNSGTFAILFPQDAHAPGCYADGVCSVKKIIGKVLVNP